MVSHSDFMALRDSSTSSHRGEGLSTFNKKWPYKEFVDKNTDEGFRTNFLGHASTLNRLAMAVIHLSGGPSPRGTEQAVTRLVNSETEQMRNVQVIGQTIGVENGYVNVPVGMSHKWYVTVIIEHV
jgi:hypothetical protein